MCGKLNFWLYGFRPAASAWEVHYSEKLEHAGFVRGHACAVLCYHEERDLSLAVHGDDFILCGAGEELTWITQQMQEWYEIKVRATLGPEEGDDKEVVVFGRTAKWCHWAKERRLMPSTESC